MDEHDDDLGRRYFERVTRREPLTEEDERVIANLLDTEHDDEHPLIPHETWVDWVILVLSLSLVTFSALDLLWQFTRI
jgi:hypothetical protein